MPVEVKCPQCQSLLRIADENLGRKSRCPSCSHVFTAAASQSPESPFTAPLPESNPLGAMPGAQESSSNPYAPIYSEAEPTPTRGPIVPRAISMDEVISSSWSIFKKHWPMACVVVLIIAGVNFGANMLQNLLVGIVSVAVAEPAVSVIVQIVLGVAFWGVQIWLQLGQTIVMLDIARGLPINVSKLFSAGPVLVNGLIATILVSLGAGGIALVLIGIPGGIGFAIAQAPEGAAVGAFVGALIAAAPLAIYFLAVSQFQPLIVDRNLGAVDSIKKSIEITKGNRLSLFVLVLVLSLIGFASVVLGLLMLCVGIFPAMIGFGAFSALVLAVTFLSMTSQQIVVPDQLGMPGSQPTNILP